MMHIRGEVKVFLHRVYNYQEENHLPEFENGLQAVTDLAAMVASSSATLRAATLFSDASLALHSS